MSNPYIKTQVNNNYIQPQMQQQSGYNYNTSAQTNPVVQNPYDYSFYQNNGNNFNYSISYPYNQIYLQNANQKYTKLGQIKSPSGEDVYLYKLANGQNVAIMPRKNQAAIVKSFVNDGAISEIDPDAGISHVIEHCVFKGSDKLQDGDVFRLTGQMGADTNASTDFALVDYYISAPFMDEENLNKSIEIQGDMLSTPKFDKEAVESEKHPICSEISMINDDPSTVCYDKVIRNLFQIDSESQNIVAGSIDTVQGVESNDLANRHKKSYTPENIYTVIIGDVDVDKTIDKIASSFNFKQNYNTKEDDTQRILTPIQQAKREDIRSSKTNFTQVFMGFSGPKPQNSKDFVIKDMIDYYLTSCSTSDLKNKLEKISGVYMSGMQKTGTKPDDPYALICTLALNPNEEQKGLDIFYDAIQKLQNEPLSDDDMTAIKNHTEKQIKYMGYDSEYICDMLGHSMIDNSLDLFSNYQQIARSITKEDIMNFAKKYYDLNKVSMVVLHPSSVSEENIRTNYENSKYKNNNSQISFKGGIKKLSTDNIQEYNLSNNTHLIINDTDSSLCAFSWCVNTPPIKPKNPNIPAVLAYMFEKGTEYKNQSEIERYKELNGIDAEVGVNGKSIEIYADCLEENAEKTLALLNELLYHPKLTKSDFEEAKKNCKDELLARSKDAGDNLLGNIYPDYFFNKEQMLKTIDELQFSDILEFYQELLKSASSTFVATIPKNANQNIKDKVIEYQNVPNINFSDPTPKLSPIFEKNKEANVIYDIDDLNQAQIYKTYKFPLSGNIEDEAKFELVNTILGASPNARLFSDLREKQNLAYSTSSTIQSFENTGILTLKIQTTTDDKDANIQSFDNVEKSLEGFNKHTKLLCEELVSDEELEAAKMRLKQNIVSQCQNPLDETGLLAMNALEPYGIKRIDKYIEAIDKATKEDIMEAANFIFSQNPTISILASEDTINAEMEYLKTQGNISKANS